MTTPLLCLLFFAGWTLCVAFFGVAGRRVWLVLTRRAAANSFPSGQPHGPDWYQRVMRAHANCVENLPIFAAVVIVTHLVGVQSDLINKLALAYVAARVGQTSVHVASNSNIAVNLRFTFFMTQVICAFAIGASALSAIGYF